MGGRVELGFQTQDHFFENFKILSYYLLGKAEFNYLTIILTLGLSKNLPTKITINFNCFQFGIMCLRKPSIK